MKCASLREVSRATSTKEATKEMFCGEEETITSEAEVWQQYGYDDRTLNNDRGNTTGSCACREPAVDENLLVAYGDDFLPCAADIVVRRLVSLLASHQGDPGSIPDRATPYFLTWESCQTMSLVGVFSRGSPVSPAPPLRRCSILTSITLIGSQDIDQDIYSYNHKFYSQTRQRGRDGLEEEAGHLFVASRFTLILRLQYTVCTLTAFLWLFAACLCEKTDPCMGPRTAERNLDFFFFLNLPSRIRHGPAGGAEASHFKAAAGKGKFTAVESRFPIFLLSLSRSSPGRRRGKKGERLMQHGEQGRWRKQRERWRFKENRDDVGWGEREEKRQFNRHRAYFNICIQVQNIFPGLIPRLGYWIFTSGNRAGRCRWSTGFLRDIPFPRPFILAPLHLHLNYPYPVSRPRCIFGKDSFLIAETLCPVTAPPLHLPCPDVFTMPVHGEAKIVTVGMSERFDECVEFRQSATHSNDRRRRVCSTAVDQFTFVLCNLLRAQVHTAANSRRRLPKFNFNLNILKGRSEHFVTGVSCFCPPTDAVKYKDDHGNIAVKNKLSCRGMNMALVAARSLETARDLRTSESEVHLLWDGTIAACVRRLSATRDVPRLWIGDPQALGAVVVDVGILGSSVRDGEAHLLEVAQRSRRGGDIEVLKNVKYSDPHCWILRAVDCGCVMLGLEFIGPWKHHRCQPSLLGQQRLR
ncbi:hypothetical protein PR048_001473 [Dryococelus australis]|uniref:Uncharacterized protein n=1 Tax=Dryococelus australis TaxID=614101 RepID=A0ABQ9IHG3_9NEOP|nr:hypothetical protein PR048_001473 [Dryococelus australis]